MILAIYMIFINIFALAIYGIDKGLAQNDKQRIPESRLILVAALGGAFGALFGMFIFHHKTRKPKFAITVPLLFIVYLLLMGFCLEQNYRLTTSEYDYVNSKIDASKDGFVIVQISDLHNQWFGPGQSYLLEEIEKCDPDIIAVTGDAVDKYHTSYSIAKSFFEGAVKIAPVYYITGNHEDWLKDEDFDKFVNDVEKLGVNFIDDETIDIGNISLIGVAEESREADLTGLTSKCPEGNLKVMLAHEPNPHENYKKADADLVLCGHNHGGQIIIPKKGGLISSDLKFFPELYEGVHLFNNMTMIISRGLGNSAAPVRINNYPEIVKVTLHMQN
ncbi:MAG: DUF1294 domain-containing protein [Eubacterium sp.]|nr:DUF1294 domain-containing protein [Eubacterium sp.]